MLKAYRDLPIERMCMSTRTALIALVALAVSASVFTAPAWSEVGLTIYSNADPSDLDPQEYIEGFRVGIDYTGENVPGFGVVRDTRDFSFESGVQTIRFTEVAAYINPTTVSLEDLSPGQPVSVLEQAFKFDLLSSSRLIEKYIGQSITLCLAAADDQAASKTVTGTLLSSSEDLVLQTDQGLLSVPKSSYTNVQLGVMPQGMLTKPTLVWKLVAPAAGQRTVRTTYQTDGLGWRADYNLLLNQDDTAADLSAWVTILNLSGASYPDAQLKLIAGDVMRIKDRNRRDTNSLFGSESPTDEGFEEKSFFEYHLYTLPRKTTIAENSILQLTLFPTARHIKFQKQLVFNVIPSDLNNAQDKFGNDLTKQRDFGAESDEKVTVYGRFNNTQADGLGMPLPRGLIRVFKTDTSDGAREFVGEDLIDHTAKNAAVVIHMGKAFDVTGQRTQVDFSFKNELGNHGQIEETIRVTLKSAKDQPQDVTVIENLYRSSNWEIIKHSDNFEKVNATRVHFNVTVPAEGEKTLEYTVRYTW
jgi:hypothetical protein